MQSRLLMERTELMRHAMLVDRLGMLTFAVLLFDMRAHHDPT
jgi:hypothetical protein